MNLVYGFVYGGRHSAEFNLEINHKPVLCPPVEYASDEPEHRHGVILYDPTYGPLDIEVECYLLCDSTTEREAKLIDIANWLNPLRGSKDLIMDFEPTFKYTAKIVSSPKISTFGPSAKFSVTFRCLDPDPVEVEPVRYARFDDGTIGIYSD